MPLSAISWRPVIVVGEAPTTGKPLVNVITCESSAPFFVNYKAGREHTPCPSKKKIQQQMTTTAVFNIGPE